MKREKVRSEKESLVREIREDLEGAKFLILINGLGLNVEQTGELRNELAAAEAGMKVVKNTFLGIAAGERGWGAIASLLNGPTAIVFGSGDPTEAAKRLKTFRSKADMPSIWGGLVEGSLLTASDVDALASIPSREVLLGRAVGTIAAPMTFLVGAMSQKLASLLYALRAVADKKAASTGE